MTLTFLEFVRDSLKNMDLVRSGNEFSVKWLDREQAYLRTLKVKDKQPSAEVLIILYKNLRNKGYELQSSENATDKTNSIEVFLMAEKCITELFGPNFKLVEEK